MPWECTGCFCFRRLVTATAVGATFTLVTSLLQILVTIAVTVAYYEYDSKILDGDGSYKYWITAILFIVLACADAIIVILSIIALIGIEPKRQSCWFFYPWIVFMPFYLLYAAGVSIYYFVNMFMVKNGSGLDDPNERLYTINSAKYGFILTPLIYWSVRTIVILIFWFVVIFYCIELKKGRKYCDECVEGPYGGAVTVIPRPMQPHSAGLYCTRDACAIKRPPPTQIPIYQQPAAFKPGPYCAQRGCYAPTQYRVY